MFASEGAKFHAADVEGLDVPIHWVDAPKPSERETNSEKAAEIRARLGKRDRPSTADTFRHWFERFDPPVGRCGAASNQPHILYQRSALLTELRPGFALVVWGSGTTPEQLEKTTSAPVAFCLGEVARFLYQEAKRLQV